MLLTRDLVLDCYNNILGRAPESEEVVDRHLASGIDGWELIRRFSHSDEFKYSVGTSSTHSLLKAQNPRYLSSAIDESARFSCLLYNYQFLHASLKSRDFRSLLGGGLTVLDDAKAWPDVEVKAQLFNPSADEGEISLTLYFRSRAIAVLAYTIVPATLFGLTGSSAVLVSRVQGSVSSKDEARELTRRLGDITPQYALIHVLEGLAKAQGIEWLIGVNALSQPSFKQEYAGSFERSYDRLFETLGATAMPSGLFVTPLPRATRPLSEIPISHRSRTKAKRARKQLFVDAAHAQWVRYSQRPMGWPEHLWERQPRQAARDLAKRALIAIRSAKILPPKVRAVLATI